MKVKNKEAELESAQKPAATGIKYAAANPAAADTRHAPAKPTVTVTVNASINAPTVNVLTANAPEFSCTPPLVAAPRGSNLRLLDIARAGDTEEAEYLLGLGADVNTRNAWGWTPLMFAVDYGHAETCKLLIQNGADVNARNNAGWTILIYAVIKQEQNQEYAGICKFLLSAGANPFLKTNDGRIARDFIRDNGSAGKKGNNGGSGSKNNNGSNGLKRELKMYESVWPDFGPKSMDFINSTLNAIKISMRECSPDKTYDIFANL